MTIQHKSLKHEILFVLGRASGPLDSAEIYERCELAEEIKRVSDALWILRNEGKIAFAEGEGRKRYVLADGVTAPAPAGKAGRTANAAPAATTTTPDHIPQAGKMAETTKATIQQTVTVQPGADAGKLADAMLATVRKQLTRPASAVQHARWWIDQDGAVEIAHPGADSTITLSADQAARLAEMVLAAHTVLEL